MCCVCLCLRACVCVCVSVCVNNNTNKGQSHIIYKSYGTRCHLLPTCNLREESCVQLAKLLLHMALLISYRLSVVTSVLSVMVRLQFAMQILSGVLPQIGRSESHMWSAMVPLDRALLSPYRLSIVTI